MDDEEHVREIGREILKMSEEKVEYKDVNDIVLKMLEPPTTGWYVLLFTCISLFIIGVAAFTTQLLHGMGMAGIAIRLIAK